MGLNTYPSNPFPPSTDRMDADALEAEVNQLRSGLTNYENQNNINLEVPNRKNLIDSSAYLNGCFTSEGVLTENQYYYATDYIKVEPNTDYVVSGFTGGGAYFVYYNASKTVLSTVMDTTTTFKTPANTTFVRLSIKRDGMTNPQMELGTTATAYTPYIPSVESRIDRLESVYPLIVSGTTPNGEGDATFNTTGIDFTSRYLIAAYIVINGASYKIDSGFDNMELSMKKNTKEPVLHIGSNTSSAWLEKDCFVVYI